MKKLRRLRKGLAMLLSIAMVLGLMPGAGSMKVSAEESSATEETGTAAGITYTPLAGNPEGNYSEQWGMKGTLCYWTEQQTQNGAVRLPIHPM